MDQSTDIEKAASGAAVRSASPDRIAPPLSPPLAATTQGDSQPRKPPNSPEKGHDLHRLYPELSEEFEKSVCANKEYAGIDDGVDLVDTFLIRNFLEARIKIMQHEMHFRSRGRPKGYKLSVDAAAIEDCVNGYSRAWQALDSHRKFGNSLRSLDRTVHAQLAARRATLAEYQQAGADGDPTRQRFLLEMRSLLAKEEQRWLSDTGINMSRIFRDFSNKFEEQSGFEARLKMAIFGGLVLLVPMIIMVLHATKLTALLTTVSCVLAVAVALSFSMRNAEGKDVLGATAAYTAVLVVFVGTSTTTSELSNGLIGAITGAVCGGCLFIFAIWYYRGFIEQLFQLCHLFIIAN